MGHIYFSKMPFKVFFKYLDYTKITKNQPSYIGKTSE